MIKIIHAFKQNSPLNSFLDRMVREANLEGYEFKKWSLENNPILTEHYQIENWHTVFFQDSKGNELHRIIGPFDSTQLEQELQIAKGILSNRMKQGYAL